jgi:hypothetical protein
VSECVRPCVCARARVCGVSRGKFKCLILETEQNLSHYYRVKDENNRVRDSICLENLSKITY